MATTLTVNSILATIGWDYQASTNFGTNSTNVGSFSYSKTLANGTGVGYAQRIFVDSVSVSGSGGTTAYDLVASLTDPIGAAVTFANVKLLYVEHTTTSATGGDLNISGSFLTASGTPMMSASTGNPSVNIRPGGCMLVSVGSAQTAGYTVTDTTAERILLTNNATSGAVTVKIVVIGE